MARATDWERVYTSEDIDDFGLPTVQTAVAKEAVNIHGSGIDAEWNAKLQANGVLLLSNSFHMMDEHGYYSGWQDFVVKVDMAGEVVGVHLTGGTSYLAKQTMLLDYLSDVFYGL
jgi:hypothetical protein